jgi:hypothetical protein
MWPYNEQVLFWDICTLVNISDVFYFACHIVPFFLCLDEFESRKFDSTSSPPVHRRERRAISS